MAGTDGPQAGSTGLLWRVDLHCHTRYSPDSLAKPEDMVAAARRRGLDRLAITEHNNIEGALAAQRLAPDFVIVGEEIKTATGGELIAYYVRQAVPRGLSLEETLRRLADQGAVVSVSHPCDRLRHSALGAETTLAIIDRVDALETFNARCLWPEDNRRAAAMALEHGKAVTAGSDAHVPSEVGNGYLLLPPFEDNPESFLASLRQATPRGRLSGPWPHVLSTYAKRARRH